MFGPYDRRAPARGSAGRGRFVGHGQDRERAGGQKVFDRDAGVRALVRDGRDDADLTVAPLDRADAGGAAQRRFFPVRGGNEPGAQARAVVEHDLGAGSGRVHRGNAALTDQPETWQRAGAVEQDAAQDAVLDDIAERHRPVGFRAVVRDQLATIVM